MHYLVAKIELFPLIEATPIDQHKVQWKAFLWLYGVATLVNWNNQDR